MSASTTTAQPAVGARRGPGVTLANVLLGAVIAAVAFLTYYVPAISGRPLSDTPEARVAVGAREMQQSGDWVLPTQAGEPRVKKPPLPYWLAALSSKIFFGGNAADNAAMTRATLFPQALSTALAVFLVALFGCAFFGRAAGLMGAMILATCQLVAAFAQTGFGDPTLMLCCAVSAIGAALLLEDQPSFWGLPLTVLGLGAGILTKGEIPLVLLAVPVTVEAVLRRKSLRWIHALYLTLAFVLGVLIAVPWFVLVEQKHPGAISEMAAEARDAIHRAPSETPAAESRPPAHKQNDEFTYYFYKSALGLMPWTPLLLIAVLLVFRKAIGSSPLPAASYQAARFFALYAALGFLIFLLAQKKQHHYLLPLFPPLALAAGAMLSKFNIPGGVREEQIGWGQLGIGLAGALFICCAPWWPQLVAGLQKIGLRKAVHLSGLADEFSSALGWLSVPLAVAFFAVNFFCMRLWVHSRGIVAVTIGAVAMAAALTWAVFRPAEFARRDAIWANVKALKAQTDKLEKPRLYASGPSEELMIFFTGRKVHELKELATEPTPAAGRAALLLQDQTTKLFGVDLGPAAHHLGEGYYLVELTPEKEAALRSAIQLNANAKAPK